MSCMALEPAALDVVIIHEGHVYKDRLIRCICSAASLASKSSAQVLFQTDF